MSYLYIPSTVHCGWHTEGMNVLIMFLFNSDNKYEMGFPIPTPHFIDGEADSMTRSCLKLVSE